ncbi:hypothetical protein PHET_01491 [Paragonimus heterotremus]|uniref:Uncharacterized protein n=1 Tax=Paragonimus heterotremus TaxID=100268 RepID=A0A8J4TRH9_9TREM|nr:hypothetical protein PHET_01491 [Paragonimus heterotremus]
MTITRKPRRQSSARAAEAISRLAKISDADGSIKDRNEHASDVSGSLYTSDSESTSTESGVSESVKSNYSAAQSSDSDEELAPDTRRITRSSQKRSGESSQVHSQSTSVNNANQSRLAVDTKQTKRVYSFSPFSRYLASCRQKQLKPVKEIAITCFAKSVDLLRCLFEQAVHPFVFQQNATFKEEFNARQITLFPTSFYWHPYPCNDPLGCLPGPPVSPLISSKDDNTNNMSTGRINRFEFDEGKNLLYVGGYVKSLTWCPARLYTENVGAEEKKDPVYLALATYVSPGTRVLYSDPPRTCSGLIQIWNCGNLGLTGPPKDWKPEPHLFIAHQWGHVMHMCWLPLSVTLADRTSKDMMKKLNFPASRITPSPLINRTLGHLILACQDGLVRIIGTPRFPLDPIYFDGKRSLPLYQLNNVGVFRLSPSATTVSLFFVASPLSPCSSLPSEAPIDWVGWPTYVHIRAQFPNRLFVGYSTGYVAYYDLSCLNPLLFTVSDGCHLAPVRLFRLINGPVRSMSLNAVNGRMLMVQGLDLGVRIWDIEDTISLNPHSPELYWHLSHGITGANVLWHSRGDMVFCSRECVIQRRAASTGRGVPIESLADLIMRSDSSVNQTFLEAPRECARHLIPLGLQATTCLDFSDPLNTLLCATDRGRMELIVYSLDGRTKAVSKNRYLGQIRFPICQWTVDPAPSSESVVEKPEPPESISELGQQLPTPKCYLSPAAAAAPFSPSSLTVAHNSESFVDMSSSSCVHCTSDRSFCWHKLWSQCQITLHTKADVPAKPYADYLKTPFLSIPTAHFCPNPQMATWIASGTACGLVHFFCADLLYLTEFDRILNQPPTGSDSPCLDVTHPPEHAPSRFCNPWCLPRRVVNTTGGAPRTHRRNSHASNVLTRGSSEHFAQRRLRLNDDSLSRTRESQSDSESADSSATAAMTGELDGLEISPVAGSKRPSRKCKKKFLVLDDNNLGSHSASDSDQTDPCLS